MTGLRRRGALVVGVLLVGLAAASRPSAAAVDLGPSPYLVNFGPQVPASRVLGGHEIHYQHAREIGAGAAFVSTTWSDLETQPGVYDFSYLDDVVSSAHAHRLDLVVMLQTTGEWSVSTPALTLASGGRRTSSLHPGLFAVTAAPMDIDASLPVWKALVGRYHPGGALARERGWKDGWGVTSYVLENEPDFSAWPGGSWALAAKDYALLLSHLRPALRAIDKRVQVVGPELSGVEADPAGVIQDSSLDFLRNLLSSSPETAEWGSDQYRASLRPGQRPIGAGPYLGVFSYHCDFAAGDAGALAARALAVRRVITSFAHQPTDPTPSRPVQWCTEGAATGYDSSQDDQKFRFAWGQVQFAAELLGAGVSRFNYDLGLQGGDTGTTWQNDPIRPSTTVLTTLFPSGRGVVPVGAALSRAGKRVEGARWVDPRTGLASTVLWAENSGLAGASATPFTVRVPVRTAQVWVVDPRTWRWTAVRAVAGAVTVTVVSEDPSAPWFVAERPARGSAWGRR